MSHEQVRHRFAVSQRSSRYCPEGESPWDLHPLMEAYKDAHPEDIDFVQDVQSVIGLSRRAYSETVSRLEGWLTDTLPEDTPYRKRHARKQARGAARGLLGNALRTEMVFTAPVWAWRHMMNMRAAEAADAEIRVVAGEALRELKQSRYRDRFQDLELIAAPDGMGECLKGGGHA